MIQRHNFLFIPCFLVAIQSFAQPPSDSIDKTAISPFMDYSDGYGNPGATGLGYIAALKVQAGVTANGNDTLLNGIVAYDLAETLGTYIGQINMITVSSFVGPMGNIWGYTIARHEDIGKQKPLFTVYQRDETAVPVYDAAPLLDAARRLFGDKKDKRFRLRPGSHVKTANKSFLAYRPKEGEPYGDGQGYGVWSYISIAIARDGTQNANLFIEDAGVWTENDSEADLVSFLKSHRKAVAERAIACGSSEEVLYDSLYIGFTYAMLQPGELGEALTAAPYFTIAKNAVPDGDFNELYKLSLIEWEKKMSFNCTGVQKPLGDVEN